MSYTTKQREQYNHDRDLTCERLGISKNQYNQFKRWGQALHKIYEDNCNGEYDSEEVYEADCNIYYVKANTLAKMLGLHIFYQTDPRGATIYLSKEPIEYNNYNRWGSECIY